MGQLKEEILLQKNGIWELSHCSVAQFYPGLSGIHLCRVPEGGGEGRKHDSHTHTPEIREKTMGWIVSLLLFPHRSSICLPSDTFMCTGLGLGQSPSSVQGLKEGGAAVVIWINKCHYTCTRLTGRLDTWGKLPIPYLCIFSLYKHKADIISGEINLSGITLWQECNFILLKNTAELTLPARTARTQRLQFTAKHCAGGKVCQGVWSAAWTQSCHPSCANGKTRTRSLFAWCFLRGA